MRPIQLSRKDFVEDVACTYRCQKCKFEFELIRPPIMGTTCRCGSIYLDWLNYKDVIQYLWEHDKEYREQYTNGETQGLAETKKNALGKE